VRKCSSWTEQEYDEFKRLHIVRQVDPCGFLEDIVTTYNYSAESNSITGAVQVLLMRRDRQLISTTTKTAVRIIAGISGLTITIRLITAMFTQSIFTMMRAGLFETQRQIG